MFYEDQAALVVDHDPKCEADLVKRINRILSRKGLKVAPATTCDGEDTESGGYEFRYGARAFQLRVSIDYLARALGILKEPTPAAHLAVLAANRGCGCGLLHH
jgi:hypothetical protein